MYHRSTVDATAFKKSKTHECDSSFGDSSLSGSGMAPSSKSVILESMKNKTIVLF